jgi:leader peptidase (prepilin peptidase) / N-methyltransferase
MPNDVVMLPPYFWPIVIALFGLLIGSFLNVVIYRLPRRESIVLPASHCGACGAAIKPYDNIPLVSYALLGGRCRACRARIALRYPAVEALTAALFLGVYFLHGSVGIPLVVDCIFVALIVPLVFIDADHKLLPNKITYPGFAFALVARGFVPNLYGMSTDYYGGAWLLGLVDGPDWYVSLTGAAAGALLGGGGLFALALAYELIRGEEGMGLGDVSMMCFVGAYLGWELTLLTVVLGSFIGTIVGLFQKVTRGVTMRHALPFGVFLGIGAVTSLLAGRHIVGWYLSQFGPY